MTSSSVSHHHPPILPGDHKAYMTYALSLARLSAPSPSKFSVGAVLVDADTNTILSTGYSLELPLNARGEPARTHAEQCCFIKAAERFGLSVDNNDEKWIGEALLSSVGSNVVLYTTMEPCNERLSKGEKTCVERILALGAAIKVVYVGIREPEVFVGANAGMVRLSEAGVRVEVVEGMEEAILQVSTAGHEVGNS